jgi:hypothetical protein
MVKAKGSFFFELCHEFYYPSRIGRQTHRNKHDCFVLNFMFLEPARLMSVRSVAGHNSDLESIPKVYGLELWNKMELQEPVFTFDHDTLIIWSPEIFACPYGWEIFRACRWEDLTIFKAVDLLEIIDNHTLMISSKFLDSRYRQGKTLKTTIVIAKLVVKSEPLEEDSSNISISLDVLRNIEFDLGPHDKPTRFHFDFDHGRPYILLQTDKYNPKWDPPKKPVEYKMVPQTPGSRHRRAVPRTPSPPPPRPPQPDRRFSEERKGHGGGGKTYVTLNFELRKITFREYDEFNIHNSLVVPNNAATSNDDPTTSTEDTEETDQKEEFPSDPGSSTVDDPTSVDETEQEKALPRYGPWPEGWYPETMGEMWEWDEDASSTSTLVPGLKGAEEEAFPANMLTSLMDFLNMDSD